MKLNELPRRTSKRMDKWQSHLKRETGKPQQYTQISNDSAQPSHWITLGHDKLSNTRLPTNNKKTEIFNTRRPKYEKNVVEEEMLPFRSSELEQHEWGGDDFAIKLWNTKKQTGS